MKYQTATVRMLAEIVDKLGVDCEIEEDIQGRRLNVRIYPATRQDWLLAVGAPQRTFKSMQAILEHVSEVKDGKTLIMPIVDDPDCEDQEIKGVNRFDADGIADFLKGFVTSIFGETARCEVEPCTSKIVSIVLEYPPSEEKTAETFRMPIDALLRRIGEKHGKRFDVKLTASAPEPEAQPNSAGGRFTKEIKR